MIFEFSEPIAHAGAPAESIFIIIFEFSAVFICYLTYYKPIDKKVGLVHPQAAREMGFFYIYEFILPI